MPGGSPDLLEIVVLPTGPNALLRGGRSLERKLFNSQEDALELNHTCVREKQRGIVLGNEGRARLHGVPSCTEELEETRSDFSCGHDACRWAPIGANYNDLAGPTTLFLVGEPSVGSA